MTRGYKNYSIKEDYFKSWSHDMAYILGFIVADGCLRDDGYYVKIEVKPEDDSILQFVCKEITPDYEIKYTKRGTEARWYPSSKIMKEDLLNLGVVPRKTGKECVPKSLPNKYLWDFVRGYFDGDGSVEDCCVSVTCNSKIFINELKNKCRVGRTSPDRMNHRWIIEEKKSLKKFRDRLYCTGSFFLQRKKTLMDSLLSDPKKSGRFSIDEDNFIIENYGLLTRREIANKLERKPLSIKNRIRYLKLANGGVPSAV